MKACICAIFTFALPLLIQAEPTIQQNYLAVHLEIKDGDAFVKQKDYLGGLVRFKVAGMFLERMRNKYPDWEAALVTRRTNDCREKVVELEPLAARQFREKTKDPLSSGPSISVLYDQGLKEPDTWKAMNEIEEYLTMLDIMHQQDPKWEAGLIEDRIKSVGQEVARLETRALKAVMPRPAGEQTHQ